MKRYSHTHTHTRTDGRLELLNSINKRSRLFHLAKVDVRFCFIAPAILYFTMAIHHGRSCKSQIRRDIVKFYGLPDPRYSSYFFLKNKTLQRNKEVFCPFVNILRAIDNFEITKEFQRLSILGTWTWVTINKLQFIKQYRSKTNNELLWKHTKTTTPLIKTI